VTVWWARLADARPSHVDLLDPVERERRAAYRLDADRDRFTTGVAVSRTVLDRLLRRPPEAVPLDRTCPSCGRPHGRPRLPGDGPPFVSVSHAGGLVPVAVADSPATGVGVDVEPASADVDGLADQVLSPAERASGGGRPDAVLRIWARKEAVLKARGTGLSNPMSSFSVDHPPADLSLRDLTWAGPTYLACVAVRGPAGPPLVVRELAA